MAVIQWTPELDRRISRLRARGLSYEAVGRELNMSGKMVWYRIDKIKAGVATHVASATREGRAIASAKIDAADARFIAALVETFSGEAADAWQLYHVLKLSPSVCASRIGVSRGEFWSLIAEQATEIRERTVAISMSAHRVPERETSVNPAYSHARAQGRGAARGAKAEVEVNV